MEIIVPAALAVAGIVFLCLMFSRYQALQRFAVMEMILAVTVAAGSAWGFYNAQNYTVRQYLNMLGVYLSAASPYMDYLEELEGADAGKEQEKLRRLLYSLLPSNSDGQTKPVYTDAAVFTRDQGGFAPFLTLAGGDWPDGMALAGLAKKASETGTCAYDVSVKKDWKGYPESGFLAICAKGKIAPKKVLLVKIPMEPTAGELDALLDGYLCFGFVILLAGTVILMTVTAAQGAELNRMCRFMRRIGEGSREWKKPFCLSREMSLMWNSLGEVVRGIAGHNYAASRLARSYSRFAPAHIEKLMNKASILEVLPGDFAVTAGVLALVCLALEDRAEDAGFLQSLNESFTLLLNEASGREGVLLTASGNLRLLAFWFPKDAAGQAAGFGIMAAAGLGERLQSDAGQFSILLHEACYGFGIAGNEDMACLVLISEKSQLEKYTDRLRRMGIRMAEAGEGSARAKNTASRYLGYVEEQGERLPLYEILDARPAPEKELLLKTDKSFQEGLALFYRNDFYLSRNQFARVLKESPFDEAARWYLFTCERLLAGGDGQETGHGFLAGEITE